ncbi:hypothetical protein RhiirB3_530416 [Rhizophagus irregularis]|nr:hypothetical protein RhiirB3_530416 [Rhizophagus irregularis]
MMIADDVVTIVDDIDVGVAVNLVDLVIFAAVVRLIAEENSDGSRRTIMTKRNHNSASVTSTTTTVISPIAEAAAKASWNKPDINDHLSADERKDYQIQWKM